eukprot:GHUV01002888.1.p1 GENE.GHUV01002888.1~~GHUV01002888.1.p1  ORF type:complete len:873 (+),score=203.93 GHUV01002888.1:194-2812(+)
MGAQYHNLTTLIVFTLFFWGGARAASLGVRTLQQAATYSTAATTSIAGGPTTVTQLALNSEVLSEYGTSFEQLSVEATPETASRLHVKISPVGQQRWEVPESIVQRPGPAADLSPSSIAYEVQRPAGEPGQPFALTVTRRSSGEPIFDTSGHRFVFKDQYIELTTNVPADADLYGIGEVSLPTGPLLPRDGTVITLWARDLASALPYANLYGSHPFYLQINKDGSSHGVLFLNSNGMDVILNSTSLTYRVIGGLIDLYFFTGPTPEEVIRQYHEVIGFPAMPPYWSLGFHQTRWGYANISVLEQVIANYSAAGLPLETVWSDIEYMQNKFWTMEFDPYRYPANQMKALVDKLHARGQHWVAIQDAAIAADKGYKAFEEGTRDRVFITDHTGKDYLGQVWPGSTVYPDYLENPRTSKWLHDQLTNMYSQVPYDGLWLDMNEASNFCSGMQCQPNTASITAMHWLNVETPRDYNILELIPHRTTCQMTCKEGPADNLIENPPYKIHNFDNDMTTRQVSLATKTIAPSALHANGVKEYDAHNLYGTAMALEHHKAFIDITGKRPFLLTRSTFPGAGKFTAHWTGDNGVNWENIYVSIAGLINTNMWGMPMVGADICGFNDILFWDDKGKLSDSELQELCNRWASVGAFYPFSRNHYGYNTRSHEYYQWDDVTQSAKKAYTLRYQLLTYMYGAFYLANQKGGTVARPLLFTDPSDLGARNATKQWMMGDSLLISPVLTPGTSKIQAHFTAGNWYSAWDYSQLSVAKGQDVELNLPLGEIGVHFRGGAVIPMQQYAQVTRDIRLSAVTLVVTLPAEVATGTKGASGPLPPYYQEETCAAAHGKNAGQLVSCGVLYMDKGDNVLVTPDNTLQVSLCAG